MVNTIEEFCDICMRDQGSYRYSTKDQTALDSRTLAWFPMDISPMIKPLVDRRKQLKKSKIPLEVALSTKIKNIVNTLWGISTSVYFKINNIVVSDIVTSEIRCTVIGRQLSSDEALNTVLSVTDGGPYSFNTVNFLDTKKPKPGMNSLSDLTLLQKHPSITVGRLAGLDWDSLCAARGGIY